MLYTSIYAFAGAYIGGASTTGPVPLIALGRGTRILPSLGYAMAPYGTEWTVRSAVTRERRAESKEQGEGKWLRINVSDVRHIAVRIGDTGATTTWGVAARLDDVLQIKRLRIGAKVDVWRQPHMFADHTYGPLRTGAAVTGTTILPLPRACAHDGPTGSMPPPDTRPRATSPPSRYQAAHFFAPASRCVASSGSPRSRVK